MLRRLLNTLRKPRLDREISDELRHHLDLQTEANLAAGMTPAEARHAALRQFGHVESIKETARDIRGLPWLESLVADSRYGLRQLRKAPGFTAIAVLTLALGVGATTAIFSIVNSVILQPLAYPDSRRLIQIQETQLSTGRPTGVAPAALLEWRQQAASFSSIAAVIPLTGNLTGYGDPYRLFAHVVTVDFFPTLGVQPMLGRLFRPEEATPAQRNVIILNYKFWQSHFGGRTDVLGQTIRFEGRPVTIIGVMPSSLHAAPGDPDAYLPLVEADFDPSAFGARWLFQVVGRLRPDVSLTHAESEMNLIRERLALAHPDTNRDAGIRLTPLLDIKLGRGTKSLLYVLLAAVGFLLLIACVNVASLLLARATARQREISLRTALGATRARVIRQLLVESLLLALFGGLLGAGVAYALLPLLLNFAPVILPRLDEVRIDGVALAVSTAITLLTGLIFGLVPALQATRVDLTTALKDGGRAAGEGRSRQRLRNTFVIVEIALALMLLVGAGLLARSFNQIRHEYLGYNPNVVYVSRIWLSNAKYPTPAARLAFVDRAHEQIAAKPGILYHAFTTAFPHHQNPSTGLRIEGRPASEPNQLPQVAITAVTPDYFQVMSNPLIAGRWFSDRDGFSAPPVALISDRAAKRFFPDQNPLGKRIQLTNTDTPTWTEIVGIVTDLKTEGPAHVSLPQVYVPFAQRPIPQFMSVERIVEGGPDPTPVVTAAIHAVDPEMPVPPKLVRITQYISDSVGFQRFALFLFAVFSGVALLLASIGIYGVMAYSVSQRTNEIGLRMALGAQPGDILRLILGQGARLVALGLIIGLVGALTTSRLLQSLLFNLTPYDPLTLAAVAALLVLVGFLACWLPARRAMKVDPMTALRTE